MKQEEIWDNIANPWNEFRKIPFWEIKEFIQKQKGKILDIGCGSGRYFIKNKNIQFYGIDFSQEMLNLAEKTAKEKGIKVNLKKAQAYNLPYQDNFFDSSIFVAVLHCIEKKENREKAIKELFRVLKSKATAMITVWSRNHQRIKNKPKDAFVPWTENNVKYMRYYYIYEKKEIETLIKKIGFKILESKEGNFIKLIIQKP